MLIIPDDIYIYKKIVYMNAINSRVIICTGLLCTKKNFSKINSSPYTLIFLLAKFTKLYSKRHFANVTVEIASFLLNC